MDFLYRNMLQIGWQSSFFPFSVFLPLSSARTFPLWWDSHHCSFRQPPSRSAVLGLGWDSRQQMSCLGQELAFAFPLYGEGGKRDDMPLYLSKSAYRWWQIMIRHAEKVSKSFHPRSPLWHMQNSGFNELHWLWVEGRKFCSASAYPLFTQPGSLQDNLFSRCVNGDATSFLQSSVAGWLLF